MDITEAGNDTRIADPLIRRFVEYWRSKRFGAPYPSRDAIDPLDFRYVLGDVVLIEARPAPTGSPHPWNFRYRLIGASIVERDGYDLTNKTIDDLPEPQYRERVRSTWLDVCETGVPVYYARELFLDHRPRRYEVVVMPLASNGHDIDMLISVQRETGVFTRAAAVS
jgi:hypothetical protein